VHKPIVEILFQANSGSTPLVEARCAFVKIQLKQYWPIRDGWRRSSKTNHPNTLPEHLRQSCNGREHYRILAGAGRVVDRDIVDIQHKLVSETLGIKHLHVIIRVSMAG
jgi:hypothetical protein